MNKSVVCNAEFVAWAADEEFRIGFEDAPKYHAVLCDPPYGIAFMGKKWDDAGGPQAFQAQATEWGKALLPLLHPGAIVLMFGGTRMWHRLAAGMEDAGFHIWDTLMWLHGQGFPKGQDVSKLIDKAQGNEREKLYQEKRTAKDLGCFGIYAGNNWVSAPGSEESAPWSGHKTCALKPAWEPVLCFRAPTGGKKYAELALEFGSGALNIDAARIGTDEIVTHNIPGKNKFEHIYRRGMISDMGDVAHTGRFPANLALECTCDATEIVPSIEPCKSDADGDEPNYKNKVYGRGMGGVKWTGKCTVEIIRHTDPTCPAFLLDEQSGVTTSGAMKREVGSYEGESVTKFMRGRSGSSNQHGDTGGASRFFYCAKASRGEREAGLDQFDLAKPQVQSGSICGGWKADTKIRNNHPTIKPVELNRWLATLLLPPPSVEPRRILVPFAGAGSEMVGCLLAGWDEVVGVEMAQEYCKIAEARLGHWETKAAFSCPAFRADLSLCKN